MYIVHYLIVMKRDWVERDHWSVFINLYHPVFHPESDTWFVNWKSENINLLHGGGFGYGLL